MRVVKDHKDLIVWQKAILLVKQLYQATSSFPNSEKYILCSQIQRAAISVPANIAEGKARATRKDYAQFLAIASGSASELETLIILAKELDYLEKQLCNALLSDLSEIRRMLNAMRKKLRAPKT